MDDLVFEEEFGEVFFCCILVGLLVMVDGEVEVDWIGFLVYGRKLV